MIIHEGIKTFENPLLGGVARPRTLVSNVDVTDYEAINQSHIISQEMLFDYARFLQKHVPGFEKAQLSRLADATFNRSGRSIENDFTPKMKEVEAGFEAQDAVGIIQRGQDKGIFEVPYRTLLPRKIKNLLRRGQVLLRRNRPSAPLIQCHPRPGSRNCCCTLHPDK